MSGSTSISGGFELPHDFGKVLPIENAAERFGEALEVARQSTEAGVAIESAPDHAAIFTDPPQLIPTSLLRFH